ncbi:hypothetical protein CYY_004214 [Polysphondylium violaceum]|uniref:AB hydrolase-1 domain-containing protein n=1 Tax=Polysphondylium violaceum TaxID=133409 RepID=A0A8J4PYK9_9MYCE|nr:hypothetical protein CYY_004214 [Polysphondylium violaceum]
MLEITIPLIKVDITVFSSFVYFVFLVALFVYLCKNFKKSVFIIILNILLFLSLLLSFVHLIYLTGVNKQYIINPDNTFKQYGGVSYFPTFIKNKSLHIRCFNNSNSSNNSSNSSSSSSNNTTVLFEAGLPFYSTIWTNILDIINNNNNSNSGNSSTTFNQSIKQYCIYDRYGYGWSDLLDHPVMGLEMVNDLKENLNLLGINSNVISVGWSYGGILSQLMANQYPSLIDGIVLVDSMDLGDLQDKFLLDLLKKGVMSFEALKFVSLSGLIQLPLGYPLSSGYYDKSIPLSEVSKKSSNAIYQTYEFIQASIDELSICLETIHQLNDIVLNFSKSNNNSSDQYLGNKPMVVLTAGQNGGEDWLKRQDIIANYSSNSVHIVNNQTDHFIPLHAPYSIINSINLCVNLIK